MKKKVLWENERQMFSIFPTLDLLDKDYSTFIRPGSLVSKYNNTAEEYVLLHLVQGAFYQACSFFLILYFILIRM